jgi:CubicO group peptidase (beta-lactamase class C family)
MNELIEKIETYVDAVSFGYDLTGLAVGIKGMDPVTTLRSAQDDNPANNAQDDNPSNSVILGEVPESTCVAEDSATANCVIAGSTTSNSVIAGLTRNLDLEFSKGYADFERKIPLQNNSVFHLASIAKLFVGIAIMQLVETGKLSLEDKLATVLPEFRMDDERASEITIKQLLSHTSGMPDVEDYGWKTPQTHKTALMNYACSTPPVILGEVPESKSLDLSLDLYNEVKNLRLMKPETFSYSNIGYDILGAVIEQLSGLSFEEYMANHIFIPLGMRDTTFLTPLRHETSRFVKPHYKDENKQTKVQSYYPYSRIHAPSSTLTSTLKDIKKFGTEILNILNIRDEDNVIPASHVIPAKAGISNSHILNRTTLQKMLTPQAQIPGNGNTNQQIGLSWFIRKQENYTFYGHEGSDDGFRSSFWLCSELGLQITVLSNLDRAPVKKISKAITKIIIDENLSD